MKYKWYGGGYLFGNMYKVNTDFEKINEKILTHLIVKLKLLYQPSDVIFQ